VSFEALLTGNVADGWDDGCNAGEGIGFSCTYSAAPVVIASKASRDGDNGGWLRRCLLDATEARFHVDEDACRDGERSHIDEQVSVVAFAGDVAITVASLATVDGFTVDGFTVGDSSADAPSVEYPGEGRWASWTTTSEVQTTGFHVLKRIGGELQALTGEPIAAHPAAPQGSHYRVGLPEVGPIAGEYWLRELELDGNERLHGPFSVGRNGGGDPSGAELAGLTHHSGSRGVVLRRPPRPPAGKAPVQRPAAGPSLRPIPESPVEAIALAIVETGLYGVPVAELARVFGVSSAELAAQIGRGELRLSRNQHLVAWIFDAGSERILFWGRASDDPLVPRAVYRLRRGISGPRMARRSVLGSAPEPGSWFRAVARFEEDRLPVLALPLDPESDFWMWAGLRSGDPTLSRAELPFHLEDVSESGRPAFLFVELQGASTRREGLSHRTRLSLNGHPLGEGELADLERSTLRFEIPGGLLVDGENRLGIEASGAVPPSETSLFFVDGFGIEHDRGFDTEQPFLELTPEGPEPIRVGGFPASDSGLILLGLDDPDRPAWLTGFLTLEEGGRQHAGFHPDPGRRYAVLPPSSIRSVDHLRPVAVPLPDSETAADYLIVAPESLLEGAGRLAEQRRADGLVPRVVTVEQIFDRHSWGHRDPRALRDFVGSVLRTWPLPPRYLVLLGDGHFDYHDRWQTGGNLIPPLLTSTSKGLFASDGALGDLDGDGIPELAIGRVPVSDGAELSTWLDKLQAHELALDSSSAATGGAGDWRRQALLLGDIPDEGGNYLGGAERLRDRLIRRGPGARNPRLPNRAPSWRAEVLSVAEQGLEGARSHLEEAWLAGRGWIAWVGHGGLDRWSKQGLLTLEEIPRLDGADRLPIVTVASCNTHRFELPGFDSLGGALALLPRGGAIATFGPTGTTRLAQTVILGEAWAEELRRAGQADRLGDLVLRSLRAAREASAGTLSPETLAVYVLFGDPALPLAP
ncbi:MAG: C25 family cysteine peptidase, partial [Holophagales bacterium]|nr:C25 family cysteine peptidase [Holophagales bacterium]